MRSPEMGPGRPAKLAFQQQAERPGFNQRLEFDPDVVLRPASLQRKLALFGSGATPGALYLVTDSGDSRSLEALPTERSGEASRWRC